MVFMIWYQGWIYCNISGPHKGKTIKQKIVLVHCIENLADYSTKHNSPVHHWHIHYVYLLYQPTGRKNMQGVIEVCWSPNEDNSSPCLYLNYQPQGRWFPCISLTIVNLHMSYIKSYMYLSCCICLNNLTIMTLNINLHIWCYVRLIFYVSHGRKPQWWICVI